MPLIRLALAAALCLWGAAARAETLRVGTPGDYRPVSWFDAETGRPEGTDIALVEAFGRAGGFEIEYVATSWPTLMADLKAGRFDMAVGGISFTPERAAAALVSHPIGHSGKVALVRCGEQARFDTLAEIAMPGVRLVSNPGGTNEKFARAHAGAAGLSLAPDNHAPFDWLLSGKADVMFTDNTEADYKESEGRGLCAVNSGRPYTKVEKVFLFHKTRAALRDRFDSWFEGRKQP